MDNKNHNDHNKQCSDMSASELNHKTDYCLTNLKILAKIKVGDKLCFDDTLQHFSLMNGLHPTIDLAVVK